MDTPLTHLFGEPQDALGLCDIVETRVSLPAATVTRVVGQDGDRVFVGFYADFPALNASSVSTRTNVAIGDALALGVNDPVEFDFRTHGPLVSLPWFAINSGAVTVTVIEVFYRRRRPIPAAVRTLSKTTIAAYNRLMRACGRR